MNLTIPIGNPDYGLVELAPQFVSSLDLILSINQAHGDECPGIPFFVPTTICFFIICSWNLSVVTMIIVGTLPEDIFGISPKEDFFFHGQANRCTSLLPSNISITHGSQKLTKDQTSSKTDDCIMLDLVMTTEADLPQYKSPSDSLKEDRRVETRRTTLDDLTALLLNGKLFPPMHASQVSQQKYKTMMRNYWIHNVQRNRVPSFFGMVVVGIRHVANMTPSHKVYPISQTKVTLQTWSYHFENVYCIHAVKERLFRLPRCRRRRRLCLFCKSFPSTGITTLKSPFSLSLQMESSNLSSHITSAAQKLVSHWFRPCRSSDGVWRCRFRYTFHAIERSYMKAMCPFNEYDS
ncbi:hypothetical protein BCR42DRAFT_392119 [Absidia repens]|uniref:Uncharacterized protein n=1 Tax=Absidia repens TaxID=90262 RepID=A0A1X2IJ77_9FUNG|nr:hypothetical protein BCR42DRAFT_392119 [Absidia repens]